MSHFGECLAYLIVTLVGLGLLSVTGFSATVAISPATVGFSTASRGTAVIFALVSGLFTVVYGIMLCCGFSQLATAINVIDASADFLRDHKKIIGVSVFYFFVTFACILVWAYGVICINAMGNINPKPTPIPQMRTFTMPKGSENIYLYMLLVMVFGLIWFTNFISAKTSLITMMTASSYYFNSSKEKGDG